MEHNKIDKLHSTYDPLQDSTYMSTDMIDYFRKKLNKLLEDLIEEENIIILNKASLPTREIEYVENSQLDELNLEENLPLQNVHNLKTQIQSALQRIELGTYGYCEETSETIGVGRLYAFPMARYTTEVQRKKDALANQ